MANSRRNGFITLALLLITGITGIWAFNKVDSIASATARIDNLRGNVLYMIKLEENFLYHETTNPDYYASGQSPFIIAHQKTAVADEEVSRWTTLFAFRDRVLLELEAKRKSKVIGKALEAVVVVRTADEAELGLKDCGEDLRELLNVSRLEILGPNDGETLEVNGQSVSVGGENGVQVFAAKEFGLQKCGRCWHWEGDIGSHAEHSTICGRCVEAVEANSSGVV